MSLSIGGASPSSGSSAVSSSLVGSSVGEVVVSVVSLALVVWSFVLGASASLPQAVSVRRSARVIVVCVRMCLP